MKKYILFIVFIIFSCTISSWNKPSPLQTAAYIQGSWTNWEEQQRWWGWQNNPQLSKYLEYSLLYDSRTNTFNGLKFRRGNDENWIWCFKFGIDNYIKPDKKTRKYHEKNKEWYVYSGWVEYYVTESLPTILDVLKRYKFPEIPSEGQEQRVLRRAKATIKIAPYKKTPNVFNIYFDNVGVGIWLDKWPKEWNEYIVK